MNLKQVKIPLAAVFAVVGLVLFLRALNPPRRSDFPPEHNDQHKAPQDASVADAKPVETWNYVTPTEESLDNLVQEATYQAGFSADKLIGDQRLDSDKRGKLTKIFSERLKILLLPTFDEYEAWIASRGGTTSYKKLLETDPKKAAAYKLHVTGQGDIFHLIPFAVDSVEILPRYIKGVLIPWDRPVVNTSWTDPPVFPISNDAEKAGLTVYEVRVPMMLPAAEFEFNADRTKSKMTHEYVNIPGILGIGYAWSDELNDWLPWRMWEYCVKCDDSETYLGANEP